MFSEIEISKFRGIKSLRIDTLSQINIFFGKNNCGKSSLLESIFLLSGLSNPKLPININLMRGFASLKEEDLMVDFYNGDTTTPIIISGKSEQFHDRLLEINTFRSSEIDANIDDASIANDNTLDVVFGLDLKYSISEMGVNYNSSKITYRPSADNKTSISTDDRYTEALTSVYVVPQWGVSQSIEFINEMIKEKQEDVIIYPLKTIEPRINKIRVIDKDVYVDLGLSKLLPINVMGDGIRKLLSLIANIYQCKNSLIVIDEIDNGFHFTAMKSLWRTVIESARINNVQLFISTHNIDSIRGIQQVLGETNYTDMQKNVAAHKLIKSDDDIVSAVTYNYDQLDFSINQEIEVR